MAPASTRSQARRRSAREDDDACEVGDRDFPKRRRSSRGNSSLSELAGHIVIHRKRIVVITGAGVSVASGVRPFRGSTGVWTQVIWSTATREAFRRSPLDWYNQFWLPCLSLPENPKPNPGHLALEQLLLENANIHMITQNVDGLHPPSNRLIEAHGRLGLYKCLPEEDSDTDSDSDDDDERPVHLGHRRKHRTMKQHICRYQKSDSLTVDQLEPFHAREALHSSGLKADGSRRLKQAPKCPSCGNCVAPQALLFDEGYHSHDFYQFQKMEDWLAHAEVLVFVGTSFAVTLTEVALAHAREYSLPVYNFNTQDFLESNMRLNAANITGPSEETLPLLLGTCRGLAETRSKNQRQQLSAATSGSPIRVKS